jgi:hypothetical protein
MSVKLQKRTTLAATVKDSEAETIAINWAVRFYSA